MSSTAICIYCLKEKPTRKFSKEHVLQRAFCGRGTNWTLTDAVCSDCNVLFSAFETHWTHAAIESMMRNFSGPIGRNSNPETRRVQPAEIDHLYIVQRNDYLVYEAGFSFPNEFYFRPQIIGTEDGLLCVTTDRADVSVLQTAIDKIIKASEIDLWMPLAETKTFNVATLSVDLPGKMCLLKSEGIGPKPRGYRLRCYPDPPEITGIDNIEGRMTARCAVDDRSRLYFRSETFSDVAKLLCDLLQNTYTSKEHRNAVSPHDQTMALKFQIKLPLIYRGVLKTGLNLLAHIAGSAKATDPAFDDLRNMLLDNKADDEVMKRCRLLNDALMALGRAPFPPPGNADQHRMMLDIFDGNLCFRMRLYGHLGYECVLGPATMGIRDAISAKRVVVDFNGEGLTEVDAWP